MTKEELEDDFTPPHEYIAEFNGIKVARYDKRNWVVWDVRDKQDPVPHYYMYLARALEDAVVRASDRNARTSYQWLREYVSLTRKLSQIIDSLGVGKTRPNSSQPIDLEAVKAVSNVLRHRRTKRKGRG